MREYALGTTFDVKFPTRRFTTGAPFTLAGTPSVAAYADNNTTEITAGITLSVDFDGRTGLHNIRVVATSGNGYAAGTNYSLVITAGTVDSVSVVGEVVGEFSIEAQAALRPTTAGRNLDVSAGGEAGLDWANIGSPTTAQNLSGTNIDVDQVVASVSGNVGGNVTGSVGSVATGGITAASFGAGAIDAAAIADNAIDAGAIAANAITATKIATDAITAAKIADGAIDAATFAANAIDATALAASAVTEIQSGLATQASVDTIDDFLDTEIAAILADTNELQTDWTDGGRLDLLIDAIKAVTDLLVAADAEPVGVPAANQTPLEKLAYIFMALRNRVTITSTKKQFYNDGGTAEWEKDLSDDGTTYSESEGNGP